MNFYRIGIDIGGTNTDAILMDASQHLISSIKVPTSQDIAEGFTQALNQLLLQSKVKRDEIQSISVGTTHATNAILQGTHLNRVGVIRIAGQMPTAIPSCYGWPTALQKAVFVGTESISGGFDCQNKEITLFNSMQAKDAIQKLLEKGAESLAIIGVFSPMNPDHELLTAEIIKSICGNCFPYALSHEVGGIGFIERENTTILNAALKRVMSEGFSQLSRIKNSLGISGSLFFTQNNGSLISVKQAIDNPILTISAGPTNSFIGASQLTGLRDAIIVDIGGTSSDIGMIKKGFPKRSLNITSIGGVKLNFSMPDVLSIGLGGGSHTSLNNGDILIGPLSTGRSLFQQAQCFGGSQLTLTDAAIIAGHLEITGASKKLISLSQEDAFSILEHAFIRLEHDIRLMSGNNNSLPVILVGGGASIFKNKLDHRVLIPSHSHVANAYGAALAEITGTIDKVVSLEQRESTLEKLQHDATNLAISNGAHPQSTQICNIEIIPYHYSQKQIARVIVTASGKLNEICWQKEDKKVPYAQNKSELEVLE